MTERDPARYRKAADKLAALRGAANNPNLRREGTTLRETHLDGTTIQTVTGVPAQLAALIAATAGNRDLLEYIEGQLRHTADLLDYWGNKVGRHTVDPDGQLLRVAESLLPARRTTKPKAA